MYNDNSSSTVDSHIHENLFERKMLRYALNEAIKLS